MNKKYKFVSLCLIVCVFMTSFCFAVDQDQVSVLSASDAFIQTSHTSDFNTSTGRCLYGADAIAKAGATSTYVSCVIQRDVKGNGVYENVPGSWVSTSEPGRYASVGNTMYVYKGYWYRTQATYIVTLNGQQYKIVNNSDQYWYN